MTYGRHNLQALTDVIGSPLLYVTYFVLRADLPNFDVDAPNESGGCQGVHLGFDAHAIELDWDWRDGAQGLAQASGIAYYLAVRSALERRATPIPATEGDSAGIVTVDATHSVLWRPCVGEALSAVAVWSIPLAEG